MSGSMRTDGNVQYWPAEPGETNAVSVIPQSLDNQWVEPVLLRSMLDAGAALADVCSDREPQVRTEYRRALVNSPELIINRAFLYNNPVVYQDYQAPGEGRDAFGALLAERAVLPFLYNEESPVQEPEYGVDPVGWEAWRQTAEAHTMTCLRYSWDEDENKAGINSLTRRFTNFGQTLNTLGAALLASDLGMKPERAEALRAQLIRVGQWCQEQANHGTPVTRNALYQQFIVADGTNPTEGKYDSDKSEVPAIKQLFDLVYNANLADHLSAYALTPNESLRRTALQEWQAWQTAGPSLDPEFLIELLRRSAFDIVMDGLYLDSFGTLKLTDVLAIRHTAQWHDYANQLSGLLTDPRLLTDPDLFGNPDTGAPAVVRRYAAMLGEATSIAASGPRARRTAIWEPLAEVLIEAGGVAISAVFLPVGVVWAVLGGTTTMLGHHATGVSVRLLIRHRGRQKDQADLDASIRVIQGRFDNGLRDWNRLVEGLSKLNEARQQPTASSPGSPPDLDQKGSNAAA